MHGKKNDRCDECNNVPNDCPRTDVIKQEEVRVLEISATSDTNNSSPVITNMSRVQFQAAKCVNSITNRYNKHLQNY